MNSSQKPSSLHISSLIKWALAGAVIGVVILSVLPEKLASRISLVNSATLSPKKSETANLLIVGDIMLDRYIRQVGERKGEDYVFSCITPLFQEVDFVLANLEGPITNNPSTSKGSLVGTPANFKFTFPTTTAQVLFDHNIKLVNLGNNHIGDQGLEGINATHQYLTSAGVGYFGGLSGSELVSRVEKGNLSFVSYNQFGGDSVEKVVAAIVAESAQERTVVVYTHWGEEYVGARPEVKEIAKKFVAAGADLVVGSHPHVVQESEMIGETPVYYSLGNFIFDQYFSTEVMNGLALKVNIKDGVITIEEKKVTLNKDGRTCLAE